MVKICIGDKSGKTKQVEADTGKSLDGKTIGDTFKGELIDMAGYEFEITGGSDKSGFPMRKDVQMTGKKKLLLVSGVGLKGGRPGQRTRKTVAGAIMGSNIALLNVKVTKTGSTPLFEEPKAEEPVKEE